MSRRCLLLAALSALPACGISIEASEPLVFVAPLEGTWELETNPATQFQVSIPGGQPRFTGQFDFSADLVAPGGTTSYDGSADEESFTLRDPGTGALLLDGRFLDNTMLRLSDGRVFVKSFAPDFVGVWEDVNHADRFYVLESQQGGAGIALGCAVFRDPERTSAEAEGPLDVTYRGDEIDVWRVEEATALLAVRAPAVFVGHSAIRIKRIDGYIHLQRVDRVETCP